MDSEQIEAILRRPGLAAVAVLALAAALLGIGSYGARLLVERQVVARETVVVTTLHTLTEALAAYQQKFGSYPDSLGRLRGKEDGPASHLPPERARLLETSLAQDRFERDGYVFTYTPVGRGQTWAATVPLLNSYVLEARPTGQAGGKTPFYYADQTQAIRFKRGAPAGSEDPSVLSSP